MEILVVGYFKRFSNRFDIYFRLTRNDFDPKDYFIASSYDGDEMIVHTATFIFISCTSETVDPCGCGF